VLLSAALAFVGVFAYLLVSYLTAGSGPAPYGFGFATVDRPAPAVMLPNLSGHGSVSLAELAGAPIVINFWSTTCDICVSETRALTQVADETRGRINFLGIDNFDPMSVARAFAARYRVPYQIGYDPGETVGARYGVPGLPVTFFLSPSGKRIVGINIGALTARSLTDILHRLYGAV
jgi:cytochrome c biogenesis protein CcmG/thiol:disulfide interchange protein DsbE